jgi:hypothetical protein
MVWGYANVSAAIASGLLVIIRLKQVPVAVHRHLKATVAGERLYRLRA